MTATAAKHAPGTRFMAERVFTQDDFDAFARISGDANPIHVDPQFSAETRFGRPVAHGMLLYTALRGLMEQHFPGARQTAQSLMFPEPTFAGETMRLELELLDMAGGTQCRVATRIVREADGACTLEGITHLDIGTGTAP